MAIDVFKKEIKAGDLVILLMRLEGFTAGSYYVVKSVLTDLASSELVILEGSEKQIPGTYLLKIDHYKMYDNTEEQADKIITLINSRPWSPSRQEIINALKG